jgi:hypothetical protein
MKTSMLKMNPSNPRRIQPDRLEKLMRSIESLPEMMKLRPIVYDPETMYVLGGNQRLAAIRKLGMKEIPNEWAIAATDLTPEQQKEFVLRDNVQFGDWDFEMLSAEFGEFDFDDIGMDMPEIDVTPPEATDDDSLPLHSIIGIESLGISVMVYGSDGVKYYGKTEHKDNQAR